MLDVFAAAFARARGISATVARPTPVRSDLRDGGACPLTRVTFLAANTLFAGIAAAGALSDQLTQFRITPHLTHN
jgi:hypothetical protein